MSKAKENGANARRPRTQAKVKKSAPAKILAPPGGRSKLAAVIKTTRESAPPLPPRANKRKANIAASMESPAAVTDNAPQDTSAPAAPPVPLPTAVSPMKSDFWRVVEHIRPVTSADVFRAESGSPQQVQLIGRLVQQMAGRLSHHGQIFLSLLKHYFPNYDYAQDGIQKRILDALEGETKDAAMKQFEAAKIRSRQICLELTGEVLFGKGWMENPAQSADNCLILEILAAVDKKVDVPDPRGRLGDPEFMIRVMDTRRNLSERQRQHPFPRGFLIYIAFNWTNPVAPLWMMEEGAGAKWIDAFVRLSRRDIQTKRQGQVPSLTADNYRGIVNLAKLPRYNGKKPITETLTDKKGRCKGFSLQKWAGKLVKSK